MRDAVTRLELVAPDSVSAISWRAALLALDGDVGGAQRLCTRLRPVVGDEGVEVFQAGVRIAGMITEENLWNNDLGTRVKFLSEIATLAPRLGKVMEAPDALNGFSELATYRLPSYRVFTGHADLLRGGSPDPKKLLDVFAETVKVCPSGLYFYLHGVFLVLSDQHVEACAAMRKALTAPSIVPVARKARYELTIMLANRAADASVLARWALENEARDHLRMLARDGVYPAPAYRSLCTVARSLHDDALALSLSEAWRRRYPDDVNALRARGIAEGRLGAYERQIGTLNTLLEKTPGDADLVNVRGLAQLNGNAFADAAASWFEALRLDPRQPNAAGNLAVIESRVRRRQAIYRVLLEKLRLRAALILAHQGQHAEAVKAVAAEKPGGDTAPALACLYAVAARAAAADTKVSPEERGKRAEEYAVKAVDLLRGAHEAGYFKDAWRLKYLEGERDFDMLRQREDFKKLMDALNK